MCVGDGGGGEMDIACVTRDVLPKCGHLRWQCPLHINNRSQGPLSALAGETHNQCIA